MTPGDPIRALLDRVPLIDGRGDLPWEIRRKFGRDPVAAGLSGSVTGVHTNMPRLAEGGAAFRAGRVAARCSGPRAGTAWAGPWASCGPCTPSASGTSR